MSPCGGVESGRTRHIKMLGFRNIQEKLEKVLDLKEQNILNIKWVITFHAGLAAKVNLNGSA